MRIFVYIIFIFLFLENCKQSNKFALEGIKELEHGRNITALTFFDRVLKNDPDNVIALYGKGKILITKALTLNIGIEMLKTALKSEDLDIKYKQDICIVLSSVLDNKEIITLLSKIIKEQVISNPEIYIILAKSYINIQNYLEADTVYNKGLVIFKNNNSLTKSYISFLISRQKYNIAKDHLLTLINLYPNDTDNLENLIAVFYVLRDKEGALNYLDRLVKMSIAEEKKIAYTPIKNQIIKNTWQFKFIY